MIIVESKRKKSATILKKYPDAILADVTSGAKDGLVILSPWPYDGQKRHISRADCVALNAMAEDICERMN